MIEVVGATFEADEETIFGPVNRDYVNRELRWYESQSCNVNDIPGGAPAVWKQVATPAGEINSNYGFLIWSAENGRQYDNVLTELREKPTSRRACMIYTRPTIWKEFNRDGMSDFICTNAVQFFIRDNKLSTVVQMRSNDVWAGYRNDRAWQAHIQSLLANDLGIESGPIIWHAGSLHCYERNFYLVDAYDVTGRHDFTLDEYKSTFAK
jgi:thymidylate synthase